MKLSIQNGIIAIMIFSVSILGVPSAFAATNPDVWSGIACGGSVEPGTTGGNNPGDQALGGGCGTTSGRTFCESQLGDQYPADEYRVTCFRRRTGPGTKPRPGDGNCECGAKKYPKPNAETTANFEVVAIG